MSTSKKIAFTIVACFLFLFFAEFIARFFLNNNNAISIAERKNNFEPYQNKPWTEQYFTDEATCVHQRSSQSATEAYSRYTLYDLGYPSCVTQTLNFGGNSRKTWNPSHPTSTVSIKKIAMFGGSTMEGVGVPDDLTIPSQLSQLLYSDTKDTGTIYEVYNYGVSGYTYTQAIIKLALLLREGAHFDYVIFYNGANDIDNAYEAGYAGADFQENIVKERIYGGFTGQVVAALKNQIGSCGLCRLGITVARNTPILKTYLTPKLVYLRKLSLFKAGSSKTDDATPQFARDIAAHYEKSHTLLDALSRAYGFQYSEFWQPSLMYEDTLVGGESRYLNIDNRLTDGKLKTLYRLTRDAVVSLKLSHFYDLSRTLVGRPKAYYLDAVHISDDGNRVVAEKLFTTISPLLSL